MKDISNPNEDIMVLQEKLVPLVQELYAEGKINFSSVLTKADESGNFWCPSEDISGDYLYAHYEVDPEWVVELSKKIADDYQIIIKECVNRGIIDAADILQEGLAWTKESLHKWAQPLLEQGFISRDDLDKLAQDFERIIAEKSEEFFSYAHGNIIGDHVFVGEDKVSYLLGMRIVPRPGKGYYDFLRALDWLLLKVGKDEGKFGRTVGWMKKYLSEQDWEEVKLVFALRCIGIFGWDMLHSGDFGTGDTELKKEMLLKFIKREY